jgi:hypothetical protein
MNTMTMPGFTAEASIAVFNTKTSPYDGRDQNTPKVVTGRKTVTHRELRFPNQSVVPAIVSNCGAFCGGDPDCMDVCNDWLTSGAPFRGGVEGLTGAECSRLVRNCVRECRTLRPAYRQDCFDACSDIC